MLCETPIVVRYTLIMVQGGKLHQFVWNTLPVHVQSSPSIATFCQQLKIFLLFPDIIFVVMDFEMAIAILGTLKISD